MLFCLTCFVRAEEVQFEEAPKSPRAIPSVTGTQLLRTNKARKAKKQTTVSSERHVSLRNRREKTSPWVPFVPLLGIPSYHCWIISWREQFTSFLPRKPISSVKIEERQSFDLLWHSGGGVDEGPCLPELSPGKFFWRFSVAMYATEHFEVRLRRKHRDLRAVIEISGVPKDITGK